MLVECATRHVSESPDSVHKAPDISGLTSDACGHVCCPTKLFE